MCVIFASSFPDRNFGQVLKQCPLTVNTLPLNAINVQIVTLVRVYRMCTKNSFTPVCVLCDFAKKVYLINILYVSGMWSLT